MGNYFPYLKIYTNQISTHLDKKLLHDHLFSDEGLLVILLQKHWVCNNIK